MNNSIEFVIWMLDDNGKPFNPIARVSTLKSALYYKHKQENPKNYVIQKIMKEWMY